MSNTTRFIAIIPARFASTRFPGKPLAKLGDKCIIQHVYERVKTVFEQAYVATDDERIANEVERFGGKYIMKKRIIIVSFIIGIILLELE